MCASMYGEPILEIKHLTKQFPVDGGKLLTACDDISLTAYKGKTLGVVGESGCGKSTLMRTILKIHSATAGEVLLDGKKYSKNRWRRR